MLCYQQVLCANGLPVPHPVLESFHTFLLSNILHSSGNLPAILQNGLGLLNLP